MKKIMFNDRYGLTKAVLEGRKTMTRRIIGSYYNEILDMSRYAKGEVIAIAQSYKDAGWDADTMQEVYVKTPTIFPDLDEYEKLSGIIDLPFKYHRGWNNKMFVRADLMPHRIKIAYIKVERLQDISDEDCMKEGIDRFEKEWGCWDKECCSFYTFSFDSPREAFAALIDKVSGKGTWERNPYCFCYTFKLID